MTSESDESNRKPQAPKKPRRGWAESQDEWVITPYVVKKLEEGFRRDKGFAREISTPGDCMKNFDVPFLHILSSLDKVLIEKPMFVHRQVESFCTSNLSSGTALQQDFVICKEG